MIGLQIATQGYGGPISGLDVATQGYTDSYLVEFLDLFNPQLKSLKQVYQLKSEKQSYQLKSLKRKGQIKWLQ